MIFTSSKKAKTKEYNLFILKRKISAMLVIDNEMKLKDATCDCWYFGQNKLHKGPCEHILATRVMWSRGK